MVVGERRFVELEDTGFEALVAWCCGPEHTVRCVDARPAGRTRITEVLSGRTSVRYEERTRAEQAGIETDIDSYLVDAGLPGQPAGYRWFVELPGHMAREEEFYTALNDRLAIEVTGPQHPAALLPVLSRTCELLYRGPAK